MARKGKRARPKPAPAAAPRKPQVAAPAVAQQPERRFRVLVADGPDSFNWGNSHARGGAALRERGPGLAQRGTVVVLDLATLAADLGMSGRPRDLRVTTVRTIRDGKAVSEHVGDAARAVMTTREAKVKLLDEAARALLEGRSPSREAALFLGSAISAWLQAGGSLERDFLRVVKAKSHRTPSAIWRELNAHQDERQGGEDGIESGESQPNEEQAT